MNLTHRGLTATAVLAIGIAALSGCSPDSPSSTPSETPARPTTTAPPTTAPTTAPTPEPTPTRTQEPTPEPTATEEPAAAESGTVPSLVGMNHQLAQDTAQAAGFYGLMEEDASGAGRMLVLDRNWKVCRQEPAPGKHPLDVTITLYSVKTDESC